jgi:hypothetical protein
MSASKSGSDHEVQVASENFLQIHLAEYQALTSRCSYWVTMQVALLPLFLIVIGIVAQMWGISQNRRLLLWCAMIIMQLLVITYLHIALEIYRAVCYIECELQPLVRAMMPSRTHFWRYEAFLAKRRRGGPIWEEYILSLCSIAAIALIASLLGPRSASDYTSLSANLVLLMLALGDTVRLVRMRRRFTECALAG